LRESNATDKSILSCEEQAMEFCLEIETFYNRPVGVPPWCLIKTHSPSPWFSEVVLYAQRGGDVHKLYSVF